MAYDTFTLTGTYKLFDGTACRGRVEIIPSVKTVKDTTGNTILAGRVKVALEDSLGSFSVTLPDPNDTTLNPSGFGYTVVVKLDDANTRIPIVSFAAAQVVGDTLDMEDITPVDISVISPTVQYSTSGELLAERAYVNAHLHTYDAAADFGVVADGTTDCSTQMAAVATAAAVTGGKIVLPAGTIRAANIPVKSFVTWQGQGRGVTTIKLPNSSTGHVFKGDSLDTLTGTTVGGGPKQWGIRGLSIHGNKTSAPSGGRGIAVYGCEFLLDEVNVFQCKSDGVYLEYFDSGVTYTTNLMDASLNEVKSFDNDGSGFYINGVHDSIAENCQAARNVVDGFRAGGSGWNWVNCHAWGAQRYAWNLTGTNQLVNCQGEGATNANFYINWHDIRIVGGLCFFPGSGTAVGVKFANTFGAPDRARIHGLSIYGFSSASGAALDVTAAGAQTVIDASVDQASGTVMVGSLPADAYANIRVGGGVGSGDILQSAGMRAAVDAALTNLVAGAPGALDTLDELSAALGDDANFAATVTNALATKVNSSTYTAGLAGKVDKASNLSDLASAPTARTNLGLGSAATMTPATLAADSSLTAAFAANTPATARVLTKLLTGQNIAITWLGDSGFEGLTSTTPGTDDCASLVKSTLDSRFGVTTTKNNRAVGGWRAFCPLDPNQASPTKFSLALADKADLYVISFGHNDIRSGPSMTSSRFPGSGYSLTAFVRSIEHMVRRIRLDVPGADIILTSEWVYTNTASGSNTDLQVYNKAVQRLAASYGCAFFDYYAALVALGVTGSNQPVDDVYVWPSGGNAQHPTSAGHGVWANGILAMLPANVKPFPLAPVALPAPINGAEKHTHAGWVQIPFATSNTRVSGTSGYRLAGTWGGTTSLPQTSSTATDLVEFQVMGSELLVRFDGTGHVKIEVDGAVVNADLDLSLLGNVWLPFDLGPGFHSVVCTVLSGSVTYRAASYLPCLGERIPYTSKLCTFTGTWSAIGAAAQAFEGNGQVTSTANDTVTVEWVGTDLYAQGYQYAAGTANQRGVANDGATEVVTDFQVAGATANQYAGWVVATGLPYGRHTTVIRQVTAGRVFRISSFFAYDASRTARPRSLKGLTISGEAPVFPIALPGRPSVRLTPDDTTSTAPPSPSSVTSAGFTANGTANARHLFEAETDRVAY